MGVLLLALEVSAILSLAIGSLVWIIILRRLHSKRLKIGIFFIIVLVSGIGLIYPVSTCLWNNTIRKGVNINANQYRGMWPLPSCVAQVTYYSDYAGTEAIFIIQEKDFIEWAKSNNWNIKEINYTETADLSHLKINTSVTDGITVNEMFHPRGTGVYIVYDRNTSECYFRYASY